jgi:hypothetical protein
LIIITIKFSKDKGKSYQYLLINPNHYKIDKDKPLVYTKGASYGKFEKVCIYPIEVQRVDSLPSIVTSQIRLLDEDNNIIVERIGKLVTLTKTTEKSKTLDKPKTESEPKVSKTTKVLDELKKCSSWVSVGAIISKYY